MNIENIIVEHRNDYTESGESCNLTLMISCLVNKENQFLEYLNND
jgi:hypothetical protein